jgi:hypothetical protein
MLGTNLFPARNEVYGKTSENLVSSWERARAQHDKKYGLWSNRVSITAIRNINIFYMGLLQYTSPFGLLYQDIRNDFGGQPVFGSASWFGVILVQDSGGAPSGKHADILTTTARSKKINFFISEPQFTKIWQRQERNALIVFLTLKLLLWMSSNEVFYF